MNIIMVFKLILKLKKKYSNTKYYYSYLFFLIPLRIIAKAFKICIFLNPKNDYNFFKELNFFIPQLFKIFSLLFLYPPFLYS